MIVYAQHQKLELKRNQDYRSYLSVVLFFLSKTLGVLLINTFKSLKLKLSIFSKIVLSHTQHSCFYAEVGVIAVVLAPLQRSKI